MSPGLTARPSGMFSQAGTRPTRLILSCAARGEIDRRQHRGRAAHVELHLVHRRRVLERDAAGVESDALADQHHRRAAAARAAIFQHDEARRLVAAAGDRQQATHLQAPDAGFIENAHAQAAAIAALELARLRRQIARRADVGRQVAEIAQQRRALARRPRRRRARAARRPARSAVDRAEQRRAPVPAGAAAARSSDR